MQFNSKTFNKKLFPEKYIQILFGATKHFLIVSIYKTEIETK